MGRFFAQQKQDAAGLVGITLQKLLIFFMVLDVISMLFGGSFFTSFLTLLFHFVVFMGVYRRRTGVLCIYVAVHVILFVLVGFVLIAAVSSLMYMGPYDYSSDAEWSASGDSNAYNYSVHALRSSSFFSSKAFDLINQFSHNGTSSSNSTIHPTPANYSWSNDTSFSDDMNVDASTFFLFSVIFLVLSFIIIYTKILSVVLAHRMRKMLLAAPVLPVQTKAAQTNMEPTYVPADFEAQQQMFADPAFMPYAPMVPQNMYPGAFHQDAAMMPPPFMYGQQPVFYTFAPMPQQPEQPSEERNEKL